MTQWNGLAITWLGHSAVHITTPQGTQILIDPFLEQNPKYPKEYKLPEKLDLLLLTHGHFDHIADAVSIAKKHHAPIIRRFLFGSSRRTVVDRPSTTSRPSSISSAGPSQSANPRTSAGSFSKSLMMLSIREVVAGPRC